MIFLTIIVDLKPAFTGQYLMEAGTGSGSMMIAIKLNPQLAFQI